jgi:hypothetical protein
VFSYDEEKFTSLMSMETIRSHWSRRGRWPKFQPRPFPPVTPGSARCAPQRQGNERPAPPLPRPVHRRAQTAGGDGPHAGHLTVRPDAIETAQDRYGWNDRLRTCSDDHVFGSVATAVALDQAHPGRPRPRSRTMLFSAIQHPDRRWSSSKPCHRARQAPPRHRPRLLPPPRAHRAPPLPGAAEF